MRTSLSLAADKAPEGTLRCRGPGPDDTQCEREAAPHRRLCEGHRTQEKRDQPLTPLRWKRQGAKGRMHPMEALRSAIRKLREAEDIEDDTESSRRQRAAWQGIRDAAVGWVRLERLQASSFLRRRPKR